MKTMFMVQTYSDSVYELEVVRETEKCMWYTKKRNLEKVKFLDVWEETHCHPGSRIQRSAAYHDTFETIEQAVDFIRKRYERYIERSKHAVASYTEQLQKFEQAAKVILQKAK